MPSRVAMKAWKPVRAGGGAWAAAFGVIGIDPIGSPPAVKTTTRDPIDPIGSPPAVKTTTRDPVETQTRPSIQVG